MRTVPSVEVVATNPWFGLKTTDTTKPLWSLKIWRALPLSASHRTAVLSHDPVRTCLPFPLSATETIASVCPLKNVWRGLPLSASHRIAVLSHDPVRTRLPSPLSTTEEIASVCP